MICCDEDIQDIHTKSEFVSIDVRDAAKEEFRKNNNNNNFKDTQYDDDDDDDDTEAEKFRKEILRSQNHTGHERFFDFKQMKCFYIKQKRFRDIFFYVMLGICFILTAIFIICFASFIKSISKTPKKLIASQIDTTTIVKKQKENDDDEKTKSISLLINEDFVNSGSSSGNESTVEDELIDFTSKQRCVTVLLIFYSNIFLMHL